VPPAEQDMLTLPKQLVSPLVSIEIHVLTCYFLVFPCFLHVFGLSKDFSYVPLFLLIANDFLFLLLGFNIH